jgi:S-DNA-T family DNA segregation ATPase FtsK/SpoIIIE
VKATGESRPTASAAARRGSRKAKPSARPTEAHASYTWSRLLGLLLLLLAIPALALLMGPQLGSGVPARNLIAGLGAASLPLALATAVLGAVLVVRPQRLSSAEARRACAGAALLACTGLVALGAPGVGGSLGNGAWAGLWQSIGSATPLALLAVALTALLLLGVPARLMLGAAAGVTGALGRALAALFYGAVGFAVWLARRRKPETGEPEGAEVKPSARQAKPKPEAAPAAEPTPSQEATQPVLPVIRTSRLEPAEERPKGDWMLPPITLLEASPHVEVSEADALRQAQLIEDTLGQFNVEAHVREINPGPTVTQFALEPGRGTKVARITSLQHDLALALAAPSIRVEAPVPGQSRVGVEIPSSRPMTVRLRDVMDSAAFYGFKGKLKLALGRDVTGKPVVGDLAKMPHLLIAGATGAGKSVCLNSIIAGFLFQHTPDELRFLMVDPKMVELKRFDGVPHLVWPVVTEVEKVVGVLKYAVGEMERRYKECSALGIRNLEGYNRKMEAEGREKLPHMVVIIDELADLMMAAPEEVEASICRLAQMARAVGIHLVLATQRPSVDVLTGLIKANFPSRIAFAVSSGIDSRVILDMPGAERLLGRGDMLFLGPNSPKPKRVQGVFVSDEETDQVVEHWKGLRPAEYDPAVGRMLESEASRSENPEQDPLYAEALKLAESHTRISTSLLQRKLRIGYNRAARITDALRASGELDDVEVDR